MENRWTFRDVNGVAQVKAGYCEQAAYLGSIQRLADYEDLEEQGQLVALPCKMGDDVFSVHWDIKSQKYIVRAGKVKNVRFDLMDGIVTVSDDENYYTFGKGAFLTRIEAKAALVGEKEEK